MSNSCRNSSFFSTLVFLLVTATPAQAAGVLSDSFGESASTARLLQPVTEVLIRPEADGEPSLFLAAASGFRCIIRKTQAQLYGTTIFDLARMITPTNTREKIFINCQRVGNGVRLEINFNP